MLILKTDNVTLEEINKVEDNIFKLRRSYIKSKGEQDVLETDGLIIQMTSKEKCSDDLKVLMKTENAEFAAIVDKHDE